MHLLTYGFGFAIRHLPSGPLGVISGGVAVTVVLNFLASLLAAGGLMLLALSIGEFMKLETGQQQ